MNTDEITCIDSEKALFGLLVFLGGLFIYML